MHAVITHVRLKPGRIDDVREIFRRSNPLLVAEEEDWVGVIFTANRKDDTVTVVAKWKNPDSYRKHAATEAYQTAMQEFARFFREPPTIEVNEILVEM
ncbi:MAG: antibiotic biosynthesis monooxygenase [Acidimicrobiia bacterium]|jgi:quinol monooxygenase YgiN|nr:antibiotic biosynthesis monooxygenase [Acidimicrobiia bacterium]